MNLAARVTIAATLLVLAVFLIAGGSRSYADFTIAGPGALNWGATGMNAAVILLAGLTALLLSGVKLLGFPQKISATATMLTLAVYWVIATKDGRGRPSIFVIEPGSVVLAGVGILLAGAAVCLLLGIRRTRTGGE